MEDILVKDFLSQLPTVALTLTVVVYMLKKAKEDRTELSRVFLEALKMVSDARDRHSEALKALENAVELLKLKCD